MHRLLLSVLMAFALASPAFADSQDPAHSAAPKVCADLARAGAEPALIQLAQSDCRGSCSSSRGYCLSTCRDSFCRAVCNDRYQSCLSSCRR